jgi:hypothetical protein
LLPMKKPKEVITPRWRVFILRKKAERLPFTVTGRDADEARARAREQCSSLTDWQRRWLSVQREA